MAVRRTQAVSAVIRLALEQCRLHHHRFATLASPLSQSSPLEAEEMHHAGLISDSDTRAI